MDQTKRTTTFLYFDYLYGEAIAFLAAKDRWPDFVLYSTYDDQVVHWGLAVDEFFVLEIFDFTTVLRDFLKSVILFTTRANIIPVQPWPEIFEQQGEDDLYLLVDEFPDDTEIPVLVSLWVQEAERAPELSARRLPQKITTELLLQLYWLEEVCYHERYDCQVSHYSQELPRIVSWRTFPGMKIDIRVMILRESTCEDMADDSDLVHLLQLQRPVCHPASTGEVALSVYPKWIMPTTGLKPPGNTRPPILWQNADMNKMDDLLCVAGEEVVIDFPRIAFPLSAALLPCEGSPVRHVEPSWAGFDLEVPDFSSWFQAVMIKRNCPKIPWGEVSKSFPQDLLGLLYDVVLQDPPEGPKDESKQAAWAFVALSQYEDRTYLTGLDYGLVDSDPMSHAWVGAEAEDSRTAEATAIIRACEWALAQGFEVVHEFLFDAQSVGLAAAGIYQTQESDRIGRVARGLAKSVETLLGSTFVIWRHVKGHSGVFGNEFKAFSFESVVGNESGVDKSAYYGPCIPSLTGQQIQIQQPLLQQVQQPLTVEYRIGC